MTKVLLTTDAVGGVWNYALQLARALEPEVEFVLATMGGPLRSDQRAEVSALGNVQLFESQYKLIWMQDPWRDVEAAGRWLLRIAERVQPDIVHLNDYPHGHLPFPAPVLMVGHSCVLSWWEAVRGTPIPDCWQRYRQVVTRGLRAADLVVAPTHRMLDDLQRLYGPLAHAQVIPNGCDGPNDRAAVKRPMILSAGRLWDEGKNVATLARAAPRLAWPVLVAGESRHPDGGEMSLPGVRFLGRLSTDALAHWYAQAAIYVLPARYEPFGLTVLEAALSGCALVLGDIPTLRELWADAACFVPPNDDEALVSTVNRLIADPRERLEYSTRARARAVQFSASRMAAAYAKAYRDLLGSMIRPAARAGYRAVCSHTAHYAETTVVAEEPPACDS
jgi:glycosyltransferase involved in cell wall biosynthesis